MKFDIKNRYNGEVQFTADIDCKEDELNSVKIGLAVKWAIKNKADLWNANLSYANLSYANLENADLSYANLWNADLENADLENANLENADLSYANLVGVNLWGTIGNIKHIKSLQLEKYSIEYTAEDLQIGCENHSIYEWWDFTNKEIIAMDGKEALVWWKKWKPILKNIIEISPAEPTKEVEGLNNDNS